MCTLRKQIVSVGTYRWNQLEIVAGFDITGPGHSTKNLII